MAVKPISMKKMEEQNVDSYAAVVVVAKRARQIMQDRLIEESFMEEDPDEFGVLDEIPQRDPEDYEEKEKPTTEAMEEFFDGKLEWRQAETLDL
ncbi:MAG: DNA-directed RNA polymerase subunit omega [Candidatus Marinimicrobia bacterium]|jgi:DNA-directed RNA polymerase subunit K/omega|nr:DNA-directed RNA polymerase subunit omega [Candidatus Neomarinimicrobiota bacterium]MDP6789573.1 DNA-directed RNA polymerase subunit omega [Candidatus Neomarinimicrobiota bacterium]MDP7071847.1 DNA-directed RNA polymerase subunit omega [Candidatus Neomarinimicrobiota bacterium]